MATAARVASTHISPGLTPAEQAVVAAELAGLSARVAALAARLDRLHTALAAPDQRGEETVMAAAPINQVSGVSAGRRAAPGRVSASEVRPWR